MVTSTNRPTNRQGEYRAICLFRKLENRQKAEICNLYDIYHDYFVIIEMLGRYWLRVQLEQTSVDTEVVQVLLGLEMDKHIYVNWSGTDFF